MLALPAQPIAGVKPLASETAGASTLQPTASVKPATTAPTTTAIATQVLALPTAGVPPLATEPLFSTTNYSPRRKMLGNFLIASAITLPYWLIQRLRGHTTERHQHRRFRVWLAAFTILSLANLVALVYLLSVVPSDQAHKVGKHGAKSSFWSIAPLVFLYRPKGPGWEALAPYKAPIVEA